MENLPSEMQWNITKFMRHPIDGYVGNQLSIAAKRSSSGQFADMR